jgi:UDP:flavonoid glycosyltransferase YjiC (YdhE family)
MHAAAAFFRTAVDICRATGRRGVLLSPIDANFPTDLPPSVHRERYAPHSQLLPHCAAFFNHGGVGSISQGLAAGIPQIVVPNVFDQEDNGMRIERLGVGVTVSMSRFNVASGSAALERVLGASCLRACAGIKARFTNTRATDQAADLIERAFADNCPPA